MEPVPCFVSPMIPWFHFSTTPILQYSITPFFSHSTTPVLHSSISSHPAQPKGSGEAPYGIEKEDKKGGQHAQIQPQQSLVCMVRKNDEELYDGGSQTEKEALGHGLISKNGQKEKESPDTAPDEAWIEPFGRQGRREFHAEINGDSGFAKEPKHNAVGQAPETAA